MSLSTSEKLEILKRGVEEIIPENGLEKKLTKNKPLIIKADLIQLLLIFT